MPLHTLPKALLEGVHKGDEAMVVYADMRGKSSAECESIRKQLSEYCKLDTYAMVKIWQELVRVSK